MIPCLSVVQVTFQSVLARALVSEDGETEEQAPGFKGAFMHGVARIAPDVEEHKGERWLLPSVFFFSVLKILVITPKGIWCCCTNSLP